MQLKHTHTSGIPGSPHHVVWHLSNIQTTSSVPRIPEGPQGPPFLGSLNLHVKPENTLLFLINLLTLHGPATLPTPPNNLRRNRFMATTPGSVFCWFWMPDATMAGNWCDSKRSHSCVYREPLDVAGRLRICTLCTATSSSSVAFYRYNTPNINCFVKIYRVAKRLPQLVSFDADKSITRGGWKGGPWRWKHSGGSYPTRLHRLRKHIKRQQGHWCSADEHLQRKQIFVLGWKAVRWKLRLTQEFQYLQLAS